MAEVVLAEPPAADAAAAGSPGGSSNCTLIYLPGMRGHVFGHSDGVY